MNQPPTPLEPVASEQMPQQAPKQPKPPGPKIYQTQDFWIGVGIFVGLNALLLGAVSTSPRAANAIGIAALIVNVGLLLFFARVRPRIAAGMLATLGFLLVAGICLSVVVVGICFQMWE